jgi:pyruvate,water dikinase
LRRVPIVLFTGDPARRAARVDGELTDLVGKVRSRVLAQPTPGERVRQCMREFNGFFQSVRPQLSHVISGVIAHRLLAVLARGHWADGVRDEVDRLLRGLPGNVTTEMDLAVGDLTDLVRPNPELGALLRDRPWAEIRSRLPNVVGGPEFANALDAFLGLYGDRGASEIDMSRPRWRDDPSMLIRVVTGGLSAERDAGSHREHHRKQVAEGEEAARRLTAAARRGPLGFLRSRWVRRLCRVARAGLGLREHPKWSIVRFLGVARAEVVAAGATLAKRGQIREANDVWHLGLEELARALDDASIDLRDAVAVRAEAFQSDRARRPPVVLSSDGETPTLTFDHANLPAGAFPGTAASNGVVEGPARVIRDPDREVLHAGEILIAPFTDPGWTPLFVYAAGVVTEVGGLMTHGAVVAREYGIPAVVSVARATERIRTGQRVRVDGTRGFVQVLEEG